MPKDNLINADLVFIAKYLNEESDSNETKLVDDWINASDENKQEFVKLSQAWEIASTGAGNLEWNAQKSKENFLLKLIHYQSEVLKNKEHSAQSLKKVRVQLLRYAAVAILLMGISSLLIYNYFNHPGDKTYTQISVAKGSKSLMTLPDGTKVWLNADSEIKYAGDFNLNDRTIFLEGEAYFEVAKNPRKVFRVNAGGLLVEALGTVFNVKAYPEEKVVEATLVEGSVCVEVSNKPEQKTVLKPNEQIFYYKSAIPTDQNEKILINKGIQADAFTSWIKDQLTITGETLESLTVKLSRKYDVTFHFEDPSVGQLRFTGVLKNETIEQILEALKLSSPVNYRIHEREIWLMKKQI